MITVQMEVHGLPELEKKLNELAQTLSNDGKATSKTIERAARKAFRVVRDTARRYAPQDSGLLWQRISIGRFKDSSGRVIIGLRLAKRPYSLTGKRAYEPRAWHWYEFGVPSRGLPAFGLFRKALDENAQKVVNKFRLELRKEIERTLKKARKS